MKCWGFVILVWFILILACGFVCHALALWNNLDFLYVCFRLIFELVCWDCLYSPTLLFFFFFDLDITIFYKRVHDIYLLFLNIVLSRKRKEVTVYSGIRCVLMWHNLMSLRKEFKQFLIFINLFSLSFHLLFVKNVVFLLLGCYSSYGFCYFYFYDYNLGLNFEFCWDLCLVGFCQSGSHLFFFFFFKFDCWLPFYFFLSEEKGAT